MAADVSLLGEQDVRPLFDSVSLHFADSCGFLQFINHAQRRFPHFDQTLAVGSPTDRVRFYQELFIRYQAEREG